MGSKPVMKHGGWWLVEIASRALELEERDAVRGDLQESGEGASQALRGVLGLAVRRQAALWMGWRPWVILVFLILPLAMLLSIAARITGSLSATYAWLYFSNWDWGLLRYAEFWYELRDSMAFLFARGLSLACWSWTAGFVLGSVSRRLLPANGVLICLALLASGIFAAPRYLAYIFQAPDSSDPSGNLILYRIILPWVLQILLVVAPCLWAMRQGAGMGRRPALLRTAIWTAAIVALAVMTLRQPGVGGFLRTYQHPGFWQGIRALQLVVYWPALYVIGNAIRRHRIHV